MYQTLKLDLNIGVLGTHTVDVEYEADGYKPIILGMWVEICGKSMVDIESCLDQSDYDKIYELACQDLIDQRTAQAELAFARQ